MAQDDKVIEVMSLGMAHQFDTDIKPIPWSKIAEEIAPQGLHLMTEEIVGQKFVLLTMKRYVSSYEAQDYAYHVVGQMVKDKQLFNCTIGGANPMEILDGIYRAGITSPIEFVLNFHKDKGAHDGYYTLD